MIRRLDEVSIFGKKVRFLIPHEWVEGDEETHDYYLYQAPHADSEDWFISEESGNYVERSEKRSHEDGSDIHIYYWKVANIVLPDRVLELFSHTPFLQRDVKSWRREKRLRLGSGSV
jgi:hypothetical protein